MEFLTAHKMPEKIKLEVDDLLCDIAQEGERQGFLYGFQYAIRLLIGEGGTEAWKEIYMIWVLSLSEYRKSFQGCQIN